jgi:hypothetical protein
LLTLVLGLIMMCAFYGKLLLHPCTTYFGARGDGMQIYYETLFHSKFDKMWWTQNSVNYPYGESIFFTGAMPFVNNFAKLFGPSNAALGVGIINLMMLFSPVIGALFIYATFRHLRMPWHYGAVCAVFIAYLSPQILRSYGHYSLQWVFLIPALFYLLLRFYDMPSVLKSFSIAFLVFLGASTHLYFLAFFGIIGGVYWAVLFLTRDRGFGRITFVLKHAGIQFVLPVIILELLILMSDHVTDRTTSPWGFLVYHSNMYGVFFPSGKPYESLVRHFIEPGPVELEGVAYVGLAAITGLITILIIQLVRLFRGRFKLLLAVTDHKVLNIFFWTSLVLLWFSFAHPFVGGHEDWLPYLGPVRQFRSVGRFTWAFFYIMNIIAAYRLYKIVQQKKILSYVVMIVIPVFLFIDAYALNRGLQDQFNNKLPVLEDKTNALPENKWLQKFDAHAYQAILPLPYFHIGSENFCRLPADVQIVQISYIVSLKTGLPMMGVSSARVSLSQTAKMISLVLDPLKEAGVLADIKDKRPLLLVVRPNTLDEFEKKIVSLATPLDSPEDYKLYSLDPAKLKTLPELRYLEVKKDFSEAKHFPWNDFIATDSAALIIYRSFDDQTSSPVHFHGNVYSGNIKDNNRLVDARMAVPGHYTCSFWFNHIDSDILPRTAIEVYAIDSLDNSHNFYEVTNLLSDIKALDGHWGLVEFPLNVPVANAPVTITIWNGEVKKNVKFELDEMLVRPDSTDLYFISGDTIYRNTRKYIPR